jgi:hypothetical protein
MNCLECQDMLQRRLDGGLSEPDAVLDQHLAQCPLCRARHAAARRLLDGLKHTPQPEAPGGLASRVVARVLRDRERRRMRLRRSLYVTAALAASILIMLLIAYTQRPSGGDGKPEHGPIVDNTPKKDVAPPAPVPPVVPKKDREPRDDKANNLAALTGRLADKTLDQAKVLWTVANPVEGVQVGELPHVKELDPATQPLRQAKQEMSDSLEAVGHSARRAFDYFARELPMLDVPATAEPK